MQNLQRSKPSRRGFLKGAGALLALPFLESLSSVPAFADAATKPPLRMGIFTVTGGTVLESWKMKEAGALTKLPSILRPLEFAKNDMLLLTGLGQNGRNENLNGHEYCGFTHLTRRRICQEGRRQAVLQHLGRSGCGQRGRGSDVHAVA